MLHPAKPEAFEFLQQGTIALSQVERNGIRIDTDYLNKQLRKIDKKINRLEEELKQDKIYAKWRRAFGSKTKLGSRDQLAHVLFNVMGCEVKEWTEGREDKKTGKVKKRPKADESHLKSTKLPFVDTYIKWGHLGKAKGTYLLPINREVCGNRLHCFFNLAGGTINDLKGGPQSYRSSSDGPNLQNIPIRDPEIGELIRPCFVPSPGNVLIEVDFKAVEVSIAYCYHKDPTMKTYLLDKSKDMHRDMAAQCFMIKPEEVDKQIRYVGKNQFVFPQFYGSYYIDCGKGMWEHIEKMSLTLPDGTSLYDHLRSKGIKELGACDPKEKPKAKTFEKHIQDVEKDFWTNRFPVYDRWRKDWYKKYEKRGWFRLKTGFVCSGFYKRNQVINFPVQGAAFHCLLWCLIELQKWLKKNKMRTIIVLQVHDSILLDGPPSEMHEVIAKAKEIMMKLLLEHWSWIIIPLEIEIDVAEKNWHEKEPYKEVKN